DPERLQHAAAYRVPEGLVAEETQVAGAASGRDAGRDVPKEAAGAAPRQRVEMGNAGGLQLGPAGGGVREAAEAVRREQDDLRRSGNRQTVDQIQVHRTGPPAAAESSTGWGSGPHQPGEPGWWDGPRAGPGSGRIPSRPGPAPARLPGPNLSTTRGAPCRKPPAVASPSRPS